MKQIRVIGGGLAGSEAAWQLAKRGFSVELWEMRPKVSTPAHETGNLGELVCSNSLKANSVTNACGLLKEEMRRLGSCIMEAADQTAIPAGGALAVDRERFSEAITNRIANHPNITIVRKEFCPDTIEDYTIIATGPLTSDNLCSLLRRELGSDFLSFFDASAPIVDSETIDDTKCFFASRYGAGEGDYINCPMTKEEYLAFVDALTHAQVAEVHGFEKSMVFEGCMPIEVLAQRGEETLRYGPLKAAGLKLPDGSMPYAVVQLRAENAQKSMYNLVGFQTHLTFGEQKRVFRMVPALEHAEFLRYGVMHRNTYINSPRLLDASFALKKNETIFIAGQLSGVEGYVESAASGLLAGLFLAQKMITGKTDALPLETMCGALASYISNPGVTDFQPMNANFGIIPSLEGKMKKQQKYEKYAERSLEKLDQYQKEHKELFESK